MDLNKLALFKMAQTRMDWVAQRQKVLSQNVANADTPGYRAKDVRELDFKSMARNAIEPQVRQAVTQPGHIQSSLADTGPFQEITDRNTFETSIDGNPIVLEEQVEKMAKGRSQYTLATTLMKKNLQLLKVALGRSGG